MTIRFGVLTISDRSFRGEREDLSGPALVEVIQAQEWAIGWTKTLPDEREQIREFLQTQTTQNSVDVILTTGGTGFGLRDVTPEATRDVIEREAPGLAEAIRSESRKITHHAMLSRGIAGIRGKTLIINLGGSPKAAQEQFEIIKVALPHAVALLSDHPNAEQGH